MTLCEELSWRGMVNQVTHEDLAERLEKERFTFYCGFDPTADSLHIGNLLAIIGMVHFQRRGHRPIIVVGGGTGLIGDPSGKTQERALMTRRQVEEYAAAIRAQLSGFLDFEGENAAILVNNAEWLCELPLLDFLRDFGKHFSVNVMLSKDAVRQRLEDRDHGISFTEFAYSLLQAYDFLHLFDHYNCRLQVGGSDQWGNIVAGMDLTRRLRNVPTYGLTFPLVTKSDGTKFGKSEAGNVWLDANRTSPYRFYQFWINLADADVPQLLRYFTFLSQDEVRAVEQQLHDAPETRAAQKRLAEETTRLAHGAEGLDKARKATNAMFGGELEGLDEGSLLDVFREVPSTTLARDELSRDRLLVDVLVESGVFKSKGEARRMVQSGGLYLNNHRVDAFETKLTPDALLSEHLGVIRTGKKHYHLLKFE
ncbi:MAG: tyrosine--tRNA ligase [Candidatus Hydrogenedentes bacterium]|nr:tyrosine--tRNA ligase [Candidatus Hydrogenedentota bacterium]